METTFSFLGVCFCFFVCGLGREERRKKRKKEKERKKPDIKINNRNITRDTSIMKGKVTILKRKEEWVRKRKGRKKGREKGRELDHEQKEELQEKEDRIEEKQEDFSPKEYKENEKRLHSGHERLVYKRYIFDILS